MPLSRRIASDCGAGGGAGTYLSLRVASVFIVLVGSMSGALFPVLARRTRWLRVPTGVFDFAKYFGSGVIIATAFIHLLDPAMEALSSPCLDPAWQDYPYALALALFSIFAIFIVELVAFRWGTARLARLGVSHDPHGHGVGAHAAHGPEGEAPLGSKEDGSASSIETEQLPGHVHGHAHDHSHQHHHHGRAHERGDDRHERGGGDAHGLAFERGGEAEGGGEGGAVVDSALAQVIGVAILEFGVLLHSVLIGMTLAVDERFITLFIVIVFHQTFEGLGIGSRLAFMKLPARYNYVPIVAAVVYGLATPIGIAAGLGVRTTYNPGSATASIVSGVMDALSAGILIYTGLVELLAHEFLFNKEMINESNGKLVYALLSMLLGCGLMALLGRWA